MNELERLRTQIANIDDELMSLLIRRDDIVSQIGEYKKANNLPIVNNEVYQKNLHRLLSLAKENNLPLDYVETIYNIIHNHSIKTEQNERP